MHFLASAAVDLPTLVSQSKPPKGCCWGALGRCGVAGLAAGGPLLGEVRGTCRALAAVARSSSALLTSGRLGRSCDPVTEEPLLTAHSGGLRLKRCGGATPLGLAGGGL